MHGRTPSASPRFLQGGGETGALIRAHDWSTTPLGEPAAWPQPLKTLMGVMLGSVQPMFITWGRERILIYNHGSAPLLGQRHPHALGQPFFEVWSEIRADIEPIMDRAFAGEPTHMDDFRLVMTRNGYSEEAYFSFSYTPVRDDDGEVVGIFCTCTETTEQVKARTVMKAERERFQELFHQAPSFMALLRDRVRQPWLYAADWVPRCSR
jgi:PAS domain S-box-containing protein